MKRDTERILGSGTAPNCAMLVYKRRVYLILVEKGYAHVSNQMTFLQAVNSIIESELKISVYGLNILEKSSA